MRSAGKAAGRVVVDGRLAAPVCQGAVLAGRLAGSGDVGSGLNTDPQRYTLTAELSSECVKTAGFCARVAVVG